MALTDEDLREATSHRGLKLIKSRRRKPGVGDFGLFGLADASGKSLFGVSDDCLTATADQIADFLRKGGSSTLAASAKSTPARSKPDASRSDPPKKDDGASAIRPRRHTSSVASTAYEARHRERPAPFEPIEPARAERPEAERRSSRKSVPKPKAEPKSRPEPDLSIRAARPADAAALQGLLASSGFGGSAADMKRGLTAAAIRKEPIWVADRGGVVGCLVWHIVPTLQEGALARTTIIAEDADNRRRGTGRALYEMALSQFKRRKVRAVEAMTDIEVRNASGFYRALGLKQASYRFAVEI
jgi:N-acetylglutamate synthase-like GNAT family acetyltransferase